MAHGTHWREGDAGHHVLVDGTTGDTVRSPTVTTKLQQIAEHAARDPARVFWTLAHLIDEDFLREAYRHTSKASAAGIDGVTAKQYAEHLDANLRDLHERLRSGRSQAGIRLSRERWRGCWKQSTSKTFTMARRASGRVAAPMMPYTNYVSGA